MAPRAKPKKPSPPAYPQTYEMFDNPEYELGRCASTFDGPRCFNGIVRLQRYRVTVELIDEPPEVYHERLKSLWRGTKNHHDCRTLRLEAKRLGIKLDDAEFGADVKSER